MNFYGIVGEPFHTAVRTQAVKLRGMNSAVLHAFAIMKWLQGPWSQGLELVAIHLFSYVGVTHDKPTLQAVWLQDLTLDE